MNKCFNVMQKNSSIESEKLFCYVRIDVAYLIKLVCRWKCWQGKRTMRLKEFYVRCTRLLIKAMSLSEYEDILVDTLTVCYSDTEGRCLS